MAYNLDGYTGYVTLIDNGSNTTTKSFKLTSSTAADAATDIGAIVAAMVNVTDAVVVSYGATAVYVNDSVALPASGVQIEDQALITVSIVGHPTKSGTITVPAPKPGIFVATSGENANVVDLEDAAVEAYIGLFQADGEAYISDGEIADLAKKGRRVHRGSRRG